MLKLLIKDNKSDPLSNLIFASQMLTGAQHSYVTHAGNKFDKSYIIESQGVGIYANDVRVQNRDIAYAMYRGKNINAAKGAATAAKMLFDIHKTGRSFSYNHGGAFGSLFNTGSGKARTAATMDDLLENVLVRGKSSSLFCPQFVVFVYQFVGVQNMFAKNAFLKVPMPGSIPRICFRCCKTILNSSSRLL